MVQTRCLLFRNVMTERNDTINERNLYVFGKKEARRDIL